MYRKIMKAGNRIETATKIIENNEAKTYPPPTKLNYEKRNIKS
jgi:hypothetical protein